MVDGSSLDDEDREVKKRIKQEGGEEGKEKGKEEEEEKERGRERERIVGGLDLQGSKAFLSLSHPQGSTGFRLSPGKGITTKVPQRFLPVYLTSPHLNQSALYRTLPIFFSTSPSLKTPNSSLLTSLNTPITSTKVFVDSIPKKASLLSNDPLTLSV